MTGNYKNPLDAPFLPSLRRKNSILDLNILEPQDKIMNQYKGYCKKINLK